MGVYISRIWGEETPDYEMVHSEVYLNLYVVSIALFSCLPWLLSKYNINIIMSSEIQKTAIFCMFSLFYLSSIFPGESADPICPYVRTPMDRGKTSHEGAGEAEPRPRRAKKLPSGKAAASRTTSLVSSSNHVSAEIKFLYQFIWTCFKRTNGVSFHNQNFFNNTCRKIFT